MKSPPPDRLDDRVLGRFLAHCQQRTVPAQTPLVCIDELASSLFYLVDGSVEVVIQEESGQDMVLAYLNRGHFFGEMAFFGLEHRTRSAWVRARTECTVAEMEYDAFRELAADDPGLVTEIATQMATRLFSTDTKLGDLAFVDVTGRVAHALLELCAEPDALPVEDGRLIRVTQPQLARLVGCSREMVCRVLRTLQSDGLILDRENGIVVRDSTAAAASI